MFHVEPGTEVAEVLKKGAQELGLALTDQHVHCFSIYLRELQVWNRKINLTAITDDREVVVKHFLDSLACKKALPHKTEGSLLDIGSGAGFPGLPLKIIHQDVDLTLLEPSAKKTAFLRYLIGTLQLDGATVVSKRIEEFAKASPRRFTWIVTRALRFSQILPFVRSLLRDHGRLVLCRTKPLELPPNRFGLKLAAEIGYDLPYGFGSRVLIVLEKS